MSFRTVLVGAVLVIALVGGVVLWQGWSAISGFVGQVQAKSELCSTLADDERTELVGVETPTMLLDVEGSLDSYTCRWATDDHEGDPTFVEVVAAPADEWVSEIRRTLVSGPAAQYPGQQGQLLRAALKRVRSPAGACRFARQLFAMSGAPRGSVRVVAPTVTGQTQEPAMIAHSCVDGLYTAVLVTAPGLELDRPLANQTAQALRRVEKRLG